MSGLNDHRRELAYCAYCPKLCRFACPVAESDHNEAHTPSGKMGAAFQHLTGGRPMDEHAGLAAYACTGCLRCRTWCKHENDVPLALFAARATAVEEGESPRPIDTLRDRFAVSGNPFGIDLTTRLRELTHESEGRSFFPGCSAVAREPGMVQAAIDAAGGFGVRLAPARVANRCCGYPLWAAGLEDDFREHARAFAREVSGVHELVVSDPGCAWAMLKAYPKVGVELRPKITLLVDLLAERLEYAFGRSPLAMEVSYHDSCLLGRGLGRYEGPRRLLRAAVGEFHEPAETREDAGCSGGGGLLPLVMPEVSERIAANQVREHGGRRIVTACPSACRRFKKAGADAIDLYSLLARWIAFREDEEPER